MDERKVKGTEKMSTLQLDAADKFGFLELRGFKNKLFVVVVGDKVFLYKNMEVRLRGIVPSWLSSLFQLPPSGLVLTPQAGSQLALGASKPRPGPWSARCCTCTQRERQPVTRQGMQRLGGNLSGP